MIHILNCCSAPCSICGQACDGFSKCMRNCWSPIVDNPLGSFVLGTWLTMLIVVVLAGHSLLTIMDREAELVEGDICDNAKTVCYAFIGISLVHACIAIYLQRRLVHSIGDKQYYLMTSSEIAHHTQQIIMYDFVFCIYILFYPASFVYSIYSLGQFGECVGSGSAWGAAAILILYAFVMGNYMICWLGCTCCFSGVEGMTSSGATATPQKRGLKDSSKERELEIESGSEEEASNDEGGGWCA